MNADKLKEFESVIAQLWEDGQLPFLLHLSGGNESNLLNVFNEVNEGDWIFSTHRNHYHALLAGVNPNKLKELIYNGDSMFVFDREHRFFTSAILAGTCCIAAGVAWTLKEEKSNNRVWCFLGDGAEEEGHFYEAVLMVQGHDLPCTFIIEDNDRAVNSSVMDRTKGFRVAWPSCVRRYSYEPVFPHAGNGTRKHIEFRR